MYTLQFSNQNDLLRGSSGDPVEGVFPISSNNKAQICIRQKDKLLGFQYSPSTGTWERLWEETIYGSISTYSVKHYPWLVTNKVLPQENLIILHHPDGGVKIYQLNKGRPGLSFVKEDDNFQEPYPHKSSLWGYFYPKNNELGLITATPGDVKLYALTPDSFSPDENYPLFPLDSLDVPSIWNDPNTEFFISKIHNNDQDYICSRNRNGMSCYSFNENYELQLALQSSILAKPSNIDDGLFFANLSQRKVKDVIRLNSSGLSVYAFNENRKDYKIYQRTDLSVWSLRSNDLIRIFDVNNDGRDDLIFTGSKGLSAISYDFSTNSWIYLIEPDKLYGTRKYATVVGTLPSIANDLPLPSLFIQDLDGRLQWGKVVKYVAPKVTTTPMPPPRITTSTTPYPQTRITTSTTPFPQTRITTSTTPFPQTRITSSTTPFPQTRITSSTTPLPRPRATTSTTPMPPPRITTSTTPLPRPSTPKSKEIERVRPSEIPLSLNTKTSEETSRIEPEEKPVLRLAEQLSSSFLKDAVDTGTGQVNLDIPLIDLSVSIGWRLKFSLLYNGASQLSDLLGEGWHLPLMQDLIFVDHQSSIYSPEYIYYFITQGQRLRLEFVEMKNDVKSFKVAEIEDIEIKYYESNEQWIVEGSAEKVVYGSAKEAGCVQWRLTWPNWRGIGKNEAELKPLAMAWYLHSRFDKHKKRTLHYEYEEDRAKLSEGRSYTTSLRLKSIRDDASLTLNFLYSRKPSDEFEESKVKDAEGYITFPVPLTKSHFLTGYNLTTSSYRQNVEFTFIRDNGKRLLSGIHQRIESHNELLLHFTYTSLSDKYSLLVCNFAPTGLKARFSYESLAPLNFDLSSDSLVIPIRSRPKITYGEDYAIIAFKVSERKIALKITNRELTSIIIDCSVENMTCPSMTTKVENFVVQTFRNSFAVVLEGEDNHLLYFYNRNETHWSPSPTVHSYGEDAIIRLSDTLCVTCEPGQRKLTIFRYDDDATTKWNSTDLLASGDVVSLALQKEVIVIYDGNNLELFYTDGALDWHKKIVDTFQLDKNDALGNFDVDYDTRKQMRNFLKEISLQIHNNLIVIGAMKENLDSQLMIEANLFLLDASKSVVQKQSISIIRQNILDITREQKSHGTTYTMKYVADGMYRIYKIRIVDISGKVLDDEVERAKTRNSNKIKDIKEKLLEGNNNQTENQEFFRKQTLIDWNLYSVLATPQGVLIGNDTILRNTGTGWERDSVPDDKIVRLGNHFVFEMSGKDDLTAGIYSQGENHEKIGLPLHQSPLVSMHALVNRYPYYIAYVDKPHSVKIVTFKDEKTLGDHYTLENEEISPYSDYNALVTVSNTTLTPSLHVEPLELRVRLLPTFLSSSTNRYVSQTAVTDGEIQRLTGYERSLLFDRPEYTLSEKATVIPGDEKSRHGWYVASRTLRAREGVVDRSEQWFSANGSPVEPKREAPIDDSGSSENRTDSLILDPSGQLLICDVSPFNVADEMVEYYGFESYESGEIGRSKKLWKVQGGEIIKDKFSFTGKNYLQLKKDKSYFEGVLHPRNQQITYLAASWIRVPSVLEINSPVNYFKVIVSTSTGQHIIGLNSQVKQQSGEWYYVELPVSFAIIRQIYRDDLAANESGNMPSEDLVDFILTLRAENTAEQSLHIDHIRFSPLSHDFQFNVHHPLRGVITDILYTNGQVTRYLYNRLHQSMAEIQKPDNFVSFSSRSNTGKLPLPLEGSGMTTNPSSLNFKPDQGIYESFDASAWRSRWTVQNPDAWKRAPGQLLHQTSGKDKLTPRENLFDPSHSAFRCYVSLQSSGSMIAFSWGDFTGFQLTRRNDDAILSVIGGRSIAPLPVAGEIIVLLEGIYFAVWFDGVLLLDQAWSKSTSSSLWPAFSIEAQKTVLLEDCLVMNRPWLAVKYQNRWNDETQVIEHVGVNSVLVSETLYDDIGRGAITTKATYLSRVNSQSLFSYRSDFVSNSNPKDSQSVWRVGRIRGAVDVNNPGDNGFAYSRYEFELDPLDEKNAVGLPGSQFAVGGLFATKMSRDSGIDFLHNLFPPKQGYRQHVVAKPNGSIAVAIFDKRNNQIGRYIRVPSYNHMLSTYEYDERDRLIKILPPMYHEKVESERKYSPWQPGEAHLSEKEHFWQKAQATTFTYDEFGNVIRKKTPDGGITEYLYNSQGQKRFMVSLTTDNDVNQVVYLDYSSNGSLQKTGYFQSPIDLDTLRSYVDSAVLPDSVIYQQFDYADEHTEPVLRGRIKQYITNNEGIIVLEKLVFDEREQVTEKRVIVAETSTTDTMSELQKSYLNGKLHSLTYPLDHNGKSLQLVYRYNRLDQLVALEDTDNHVYAQFAYSASGQISSERYEPSSSNGFTRNYHYNSPGFLEQISDPFLTETMAYTEGGYGETGYGDGIIMRTTFNASWPMNVDRRRFQINEEDLRSEFAAVCIRALKRTGHLNHDGRPRKLFIRRAETSMPLVCGGERGQRIVELISERLNPEFHGHRYAYGVHQELIRGKYFTGESDVDPLQPDTFSKDISQLSAQQSEDVWQLLVKSDYIYKDQPRNDLSTTVGKPGRSIFRRSELLKDLENMNSDYIVFVSPIEKFVTNAIGKRKVLLLSDFIKVYLDWQGLDRTSSLLTINWHKEKAEEIGKMLIKKSYLPVSTSSLTAPLHGSFTSTLNKYSNVIPEIVNVLTHHFDYSLGESAFDVESFQIDANGNHEKFWTGLNRFELTYHNGTNQIDEIKFNYLSYLKPAEVFPMKHDGQGNAIQALHRKILRIEYHPVSQRTTYMQLEDGRILLFYFDAQGERTLKRVLNGDGSVASEVYYLRDEKGRVLLDKAVAYSPTTTKTLITAYMYGPRGLTGFFRNNNFYSVTTDHQGSVRLIIQAGNVVAAYDYLPYGELMRTYSSDPDAEIRYRFTGQEFDEETGLYNYHARLYDPSIGRFYQLDPKAQFFSPYKYSGNSPVSLVDPDGEEAILATVIIVGIIVGGYLGGAAANNRWNPIEWDMSDPGTYLGIGGGALAGGLGPVGFLASVGAVGLYGTVAAGIAMTYVTAAASQGSWDPSKWDFKRPDVWSAMFQGFSSGTGLIGGFHSLHKFANVGKALAAGDKIMFGKALLSLSKKLGVDVTTLGRGFLVSSYILGGSLAYAGGVRANDGNLAFWAWDWKNPATLAGVIDGLDSGSGWLQNSMELGRGLSKFSKSHKALIASVKGMGNKKALQKILKDSRHPMFKATSTVVMAYFMGSSANGELDITRWSMSSLSTYEGILNGIFFGKDTSNLLKLASGGKNEKHANLASADNMIATVPKSKLDPFLSDVPKYRVDTAYNNLMGNYFSSKTALQGLLHLFKGRVDSVERFFKQGIEKWKSGEAKPPEELDRIISENANKIAQSESDTLTKWLEESVEQSRKQHEIFPDDDAGFLKCHSRRRKKRSGQGSCSMRIDDSHIGELEELMDLLLISDKKEFRNEYTSVHPKEHESDISGFNPGSPVGFAEHLSLVLRKTPNILATTKTNFFPNFFLGSILTMRNQFGVQVNALMKAFTVSGNYQEVVETCFVKRIEKELSFNIFIAETRGALKGATDAKKLKYRDDITSKIIEDINHTVNGDSLQVSEMDKYKITASIFYIDTINSLSVKQIGIEAPKVKQPTGINDFTKITYQSSVFKNMEDSLELISYNSMRKAKIGAEGLSRSLLEIYSSNQKIFGYDLKLESGFHAFAYGALSMNFKYKYDLDTYVERIAGRGVADLLVLSRKGNTNTKKWTSYPLVFEFKADETSSGSATDQAVGTGYLYNMGLRTIQDEAIVVGLNSFTNEVEITNIAIPQPQSVVRQLLRFDDVKMKTYQENVESEFKHLYYSISPLAIKTMKGRNNNYLSRLILGQVISKGDVYIRQQEKVTTLLFKDGSDSKKWAMLNVVESSITDPVGKTFYFDDVDVTRVPLPADVDIGSLVKVDAKINCRSKDGWSSMITKRTATVVADVGQYYYHGIDVQKFADRKSVDGMGRSSDYTKIESHYNDQRSFFRDIPGREIEFEDASLQHMNSLINSESDFQAVIQGWYLAIPPKIRADGVKEMIKVFPEANPSREGRIDIVACKLEVKNNRVITQDMVIMELKYCKVNENVQNKMNEAITQVTNYVGNGLKTFTDSKTVTPIAAVFVKKTGMMAVKVLDDMLIPHTTSESDGPGPLSDLGSSVQGSRTRPGGPLDLPGPKRRGRRAIDFVDDCLDSNKSMINVHDAKKRFFKRNHYNVASSGSSNLQFWPARLFQSIISSFSKFVSTRKYDSIDNNAQFSPNPSMNENNIDAFDREIVLEMGDSFVKHADINGLLTWGVVLVRKWTGVRPKHEMFTDECGVNVGAVVLSTAFVGKFVEIALNHALSCGVMPVVASILKNDYVLSKIIGKITDKAENYESQLIARILFDEVIVQNINKIASKTTQKQSDRFASSLMAEMNEIGQQLDVIREKSIGKISQQSCSMSHHLDKFCERKANCNAEQIDGAKQFITQSSALSIFPKLH